MKFKEEQDDMNKALQLLVHTYHLKNFGREKQVSKPCLGSFDILFYPFMSWVSLDVFALPNSFERRKQCIAIKVRCTNHECQLSGR